MKLYLLLLLAVFTGCNSTKLQTKPAQVGTKLVVWGTHYYSHKAAIDPKGFPLYDTEGNAISPKISQKDYCLCGIEGTCSIDGQIYDYMGVGKHRVPFHCEKHAGHIIEWKKGRFKYGMGSKANALKPFVTVAADPKVLPFGSVIYIPDAVGLELPNGDIHDGYFEVGDVGGAIKGNHLDFFTGPWGKEFKFDFVKSVNTATFTVYVQ